jgi:hypothetical protein
MAKAIAVSSFGGFYRLVLIAFGLSAGGCAVVAHDPGQAYPVATQSGGYTVAPGYPSSPAYGPSGYGPSGYGPSDYGSGTYYGPAQPYFPPSVYYAPPLIVAPPIIIRSAPVIVPHYAHGAPRPVVVGPAPYIVPPRVIAPSVIAPSILAPSQGVAQVVQTRPGHNHHVAPSTSFAPRPQAPPSAPTQSFHQGGGHHFGGSGAVSGFRSAPSVSAPSMGFSPRYSGGGGSRRTR